MESLSNQTLSWQLPFVDIFSKFKVFNASQKAKKGNVNDEQNNEIGRRVFNITGNPQSANYLLIPDPNSGIRNLQLNGRYLYFSFLPAIGKSDFFTINFEFAIKSRNEKIRFQFSNLYESFKVNNQTLQIPYPRNAPKKWTVVCLDIQHMLENFGLFKTQSINFDHCHLLNQIQICSCLQIRGVYTSDTVYNKDNLPREFGFKKVKTNWSDSYQMAYFPGQVEEKSGGSSQQLYQSKQNLTKELAQTEKFQNTTEEPENQNQAKSEQLNQSTNKTHPENLNQSLKRTLPDNLTKSCATNFNIQGMQNNTEEQQQTLIQQQEKILQLGKTIGYTGKICPDIKWSKHPEFQDELVYASGQLLIISNKESGEQRALFGHQSDISAIDISVDGQWIVSVQGGKKSNVRIWEYASGEVINSFYSNQISEITNVAFSQNKQLLVTVGTDNQHSKQLIVVWNISDILNGKPSVFAKQLSNYDIRSIKFTEADKFITCGKENINFWRAKKVEYLVDTFHLKQSPVVLNHHARNTIFTVLDVEYAIQNPSAYQQNQICFVYVGSKEGNIYKIQYDNKTLVAVFKCHSDSITSISVSAGYCITGSKDMFLRVWPQDFTEFILQAKHEGVLISLDVSLDGLYVAIGTSTGALGVLELKDHKYKTFLRSHTDSILQMEIHKQAQLLITLSTDLTIRL